MGTINELTQNAELHSGDLFPIWDSENDRTRSVAAETVTSYLQKEISSDLQAAKEAADRAESAADKTESALISSIEALRRTYLDAGYYLVPGSFELGGTLNAQNDVLLYEKNGNAYQWKGDFPKYVPKSSTPFGAGGVLLSQWESQSEHVLRSDLAGEGGCDLIGFKRSHLSDSIKTTLANWIKWTGVNVVSDFGADPTFTVDSTVAIKNAIATGRSIYIPKGRYKFSDLLYPMADGQAIGGDGQDNTILENNVNNEPLFCFGNPYISNGSKQWCVLRSLTIIGNNSGNTLWGIYVPNAALVDGSPNASGQYEGVSSSPNNFYFGRTTTPFSDWTIAARGNTVQNVAVLGVKGGFSMHVSAWDFLGEKVRLWSGKQGLRQSGAANSNTMRDLYISAMTNEALIEPDRPSSIPTSCIYDGLIVQQCGLSIEGGKAAIELLKGQGSIFNGLYLERNNERGAGTDIYIGVASVGTVINGIRHRVDSGAPVIVENQGQGSIIEGIVYSSNITNAVLVSGSDPRTTTVIGSIISAGGSASAGAILDASTGQKTIIRDMVGYRVLLGQYGNYAESTASALKINQSRSTSNTLDLISSGSMKFIIDQVNIGSGRNFKWAHNGDDGFETTLMLLADSGHLTPGSDNLQNLGGASSRMATLYAGTGTINTSDAREKSPPLQINDSVLDAWEDVEIVMFQWLDMMRQKGADVARWHFGVIAQQVRDAFSSHGLDGCDYGLLCYDEWGDEFEPITAIRTNHDTGEDEEYETGEVRKIKSAGNRWGIRPDQCLFIEAACHRRRYEKIESRIAKLEKIIGNQYNADENKGR